MSNNDNSAPEIDWDPTVKQDFCRCGEVSMSWGDVCEIEAGAWARLEDWGHRRGVDSTELLGDILEGLVGAGACRCEVGDVEFDEALRTLDSGDLWERASRLGGLGLCDDTFTVTAGELAALLRTAQAYESHVVSDAPGGAEYDAAADMLDAIDRLTHRLLKA